MSNQTRKQRKLDLPFDGLVLKWEPLQTLPSPETSSMLALLLRTEPLHMGTNPYYRRIASIKIRRMEIPAEVLVVAEFHELEGPRWSMLAWRDVRTGRFIQATV